MSSGCYRALVWCCNALSYAPMELDCIGVWALEREFLVGEAMMCVRVTAKHALLERREQQQQQQHANFGINNENEKGRERERERGE